MSGVGRTNSRHTLESHAGRLSNLERRTKARPAQRPGRVFFEETFSMDTVAVAESGRYYPRITATLYELVVTLVDGTATVQAKVNGGIPGDIDAIDIDASSDDIVKLAVNDVLQADTDYLTVACTDGSGSKLVVVARFSA